MTSIDTQSVQPGMTIHIPTLGRDVTATEIRHVPGDCVVITDGLGREYALPFGRLWPLIPPATERPYVILWNGFIAAMNPRWVASASHPIALRFASREAAMAYREEQVWEYGASIFRTPS